jgi:zinc-ribbon domain
MRCPKCGNEVSQDEVFCGQCGTPITLPAGATEMVNTPSPRNGLPGPYNANALNNPHYPNVPPLMPPGQSSYPPQLPPSNAYNNATRPVPPSGPLAPRQQPSQQLRQPLGGPPAPVGPQQQSGFYQDATEAIVSIPQNNSPVYPPGYQQQQPPGFISNPGQSGYVGGSQYGTQGPYPTPNFPATNYPAAATPPGQGYGYSTPPRPTPPPKKQASALLIFAIVCLIVAVITVGAFGLIYLLHNHPSHSAIVPTVVPTAAATPTAVPSPTPSPTALATATPTPVPSPAVTPTPPPDPNFAWCSICTPNGFNVEYPLGWNQTNPTAGSTTDIRFLNTSPNDQYADFKTLGATTSSASDLVTADLQANYSSLPGYTAPTGGALNYTIGGENWTYEIASYQLNGQAEQIVVYATVHQQKAYIIELQASVSQYNTVFTQYYTAMLGKFFFQ